jgi:hypothetical protein
MWLGHFAQTQATVSRALRDQSDAPLHALVCIEPGDVAAIQWVVNDAMSMKHQRRQ